MSELFSNRWTLITGASSGFGEQFARQLAARGANLILTARSTSKLEALADELASEHRIDTRVVSGDLTGADGPREICSGIDQLGLGVEHLINNAGFGSFGPFVDSDPDHETRMVRLNCEALLAMSRHFLPDMVARGSGGIIHVASTSSYQPTPQIATYGATKAFVLNFSVALSQEVRGSGVRVLALCPGVVRTGFQQSAGVTLSPAANFTTMSAEDTIAQGLRAYCRGKDVYIPGVSNKLSALTMAMLPRTLAARTVDRMLSVTGWRHR